MTFIVYQDTAANWRWQLTVGQSWVLAVSAESYISRTDCLYAVQVAKGAGVARVVDASGLELGKRPPSAANGRRAA